MTNIKNVVTSIFAMIMMLMVGGAFAQGAPWTCDGKFYQVRAPAGSPSTLYSIINPPDNSAFQVTPFVHAGDHFCHAQRQYICQRPRVSQGR